MSLAANVSSGAVRLPFAEQSALREGLEMARTVRLCKGSRLSVSGARAMGASTVQSGIPVLGEIPRGLGLYIVKAIVGAMGGTVRAESAIGAGATFVVDLPCGEPEQT